MFWLFHKTQPFEFKENLTSGECFLAWHEAIFELRKKNVATAHTIAENLEKRMQSITQNKVFLAAVWVDSRSRILLNSDQKEKLELFSVHKRLKKVNNDDEPSFNSDENVDVNNREASEFESYLNSLAATTKQSPDTPLKILYEAGLEKIKKLGRQKIENVWEGINAHPEFLNPACQIVSALPSTQVSVERMFSQLKLLLRENLCRMKTELADAILFLRMNKCV